VPLNQPFQPTPLRVDKIGSILRVGISYNANSIEWCGVAERQTVGLLISFYNSHSGTL